MAMERQYGLYINGAECAGGDGVEEAICPYTEKPWARVSQASEDDVRKAIEAARQAFESWRKVPGVQRAKLILRLADLIGMRSRHYPSSKHCDVAKCQSQAIMAYILTSYQKQKQKNYPGWRQWITAKSGERRRVGRLPLSPFIVLV
jgi:hypothetical protein